MSIAAFAISPDLAPGEPERLTALRAKGRALFTASGVPTRRAEAWRFTELRRLIDTPFQPVAAPADLGRLEAVLSDGLGNAAAIDRLVFINGRFAPAQSAIGRLPDGVVLGSFADWARAQPDKAIPWFDLAGGVDRAFLSLNAACFTDGAVLIVPDGVTLERPIHILHWGEAETPAAIHAKGLLRLGAEAKAVVIESLRGAGPAWTNAALSVEIGAGAELSHTTLQDAPESGFHTGHLAVTIGRQGRYDGFLLSLGASVARQDFRATIAGDHGFCGYSGAYLLRGRQESTIASVIQHAAPHGETREVFRGCLDDRAHGVFQGKILVDQIAQKTNAYQLSKTILLGDRAAMDAKPELEIYADDVKCSHGATVGDLDETALFYLRSRGIDPATARHMLIEAFITDAVEWVADETARLYLRREIARRLAGSED